MPVAELRHLVLVLGDQLDLNAAAFDGFDAAQDAVWMAEVAEESTHVWSSKPRTVLFLAAMRHFAQALRAGGRPLHYTRLDDPANHSSLSAQLHADLERLRPTGLVITVPGDWRVLQAIKDVAQTQGLPLDIREDRHFYCSVREFAAHARGRKALRMEYFYRELRKRHDVLMQGAAPEGGQWNFDADNRGAFGAAGPGPVPPRAVFAPDALTRDVIALVEQRFATHPGRLDSFAWPVTRAQALIALQRFITERLPLFGRYQDAMWPGEPWLPNTLGMSQYADGGLMASKPYVATGKYIQRMSPYCHGCRYDPAQRTGDTACPFTTLYWDFLMRHEALLAANPRMALQVKNLTRLSDAQRQAIRERAAAIRRGAVT